MISDCRCNSANTIKKDKRCNEGGNCNCKDGFMGKTCNETKTISELG